MNILKPLAMYGYIKPLIPVWEAKAEGPQQAGAQPELHSEDRAIRSCMAGPRHLHSLHEALEFKPHYCKTKQIDNNKKWLV